MKRLMGIMIVAMLLLNGCILTSFNPFYNKSDLIKNDALLGEWVGQKAILSFKKLGESSYLINYKDCEDPINAPDDYSMCTIAEFTGRLMQLQDDLFIDFYPRSFLNSDNIFLGFHVKPSHSLAQITIEETYMEVRLVSYSWIANYLESHKSALDHVKIDDVITLTASTPELQDFVLKHKKTPEFFDDPIVLKRK